MPAPSDRRAQIYARPAKGHHWTGPTITHILTSEAALGYLMHRRRPVTGADGKPVKIAPPLWDWATHDALVAKTAPKRKGSTAPKAGQLLCGIAWCGCCGARLYLSGRRADGTGYACTGRVRGIQASAGCKPAPCIGVAALDAQVSAWFASTYGAGEVMKKVWDAGSGHSAQIAELTTARDRLKADRDAGLYDDADEAEWYRARYRSISDEITALRALPERKPGMIEISTGRTIGQEWDAADKPRRREMLAEFAVGVVVNAKKGSAATTPRVSITGIDAPAARLIADAA